jgi:hypothetical protein
MSARIFISGLLAVLAGQLPPQATLAKRALYAKLAKPLSFKVLRQVVENTVGDVVQLVRTLPRHSLESYTVTAETLYSTLALFSLSPAMHSRIWRAFAVTSLHL